MTTETTPPGAPTDHLHSRASYGQADRNCDVIMKGGITSGVVYPLAACELATRFKFRNVGGTSAGAIAAAAAAAAECGREVDKKTAGFVGLAEMQQWLSADRNLIKLFQPNRGTAAVFSLLVAFIRKPAGLIGQIGKWIAVVFRFLIAALFNRFVFIALFFALPGLALVQARQHAFEPTLELLVGVALALILVVVGFLLPSRPNVAALVAAITGVGLIWWMLVNDVDWILWGGVASWLVLVVGVLLGLLTSAILSALQAIGENKYGLITGSPDDEPQEPYPLSDWLTERLNLLAGMPGDSTTPLTFGHLWAGPDNRDRKLEEISDKEWAAIESNPAVNLEMLTTCLSEGRPYRMPRDFGHRYFFKDAELREYFPKTVVKYMIDHPPVPSDNDERDLYLRAAKHGLAPLPEPRYLPVVVSTRMSLSFPGLISAVPLYSIDFAYMRDENGSPTTIRGKAIPEVTWFSDGGITSNFPVSFFDHMLPRWPTFGINLRKFHPSHPKSSDEECNIYLPRDNQGGILEWRTRWPERGLKSIMGFGASILDTMQNWVDNEQLRVPGFRDRVVHVSHDDKEGGMNLDMPANDIAAMSERGRLAGARLARYYTEEPSPNEPPDCASGGTEQTTPRTVGWRNHRWVRLRSALGMLERLLGEVQSAYVDEGEPYRRDIQLYFSAGEERAALDPRRVVGPSYKWGSGEQRTLAVTLMQGTPDEQWDPPPAGNPAGGLVGLAAELMDEISENPTWSLREGDPNPEPDLRIVPGHSQAES